MARPGRGEGGVPLIDEARYKVIREKVYREEPLAPDDVLFLLVEVSVAIRAEKSHQAAQGKWYSQHKDSYNQQRREQRKELRGNG